MNDQTRLNTPVPECYLIPAFVSESEEAYLLTKIEEVGGTAVDNDDATAEQTTRKYKSKPTGWREVKGRRSMYWGGSVLKNALIPTAMPAFMQDQFPRIINRIAETGAFHGSKHKVPNHVLVNEYLPGQGIFPHEDGPAYFPTVTTLSLGSHTILDIFAYATKEDGDATSETEGAKTYQTNPAFSILIPRRSLFILRSDLYTTCLHGIAARHTDSLEELQKCVNWEDISSRRSRWELGDETNNTSVWERSRRVSLTVRTVEKVLNLKGLTR